MTLRLENISIRIGGVPLIAAFSLSVQDGEIITRLFAPEQNSDSMMKVLGYEKQTVKGPITNPVA